MDKTIQIVVVAMILMITAVAVMTMFSSQLNPFDNATDRQINQAECSTQETNYELACDCEEGGETQKAEGIRTKFEEQCQNTDWDCGCES